MSLFNHIIGVVFQQTISVKYILEARSDILFPHGTDQAADLLLYVGHVQHAYSVDLSRDI